MNKNLKILIISAIVLSLLSAFLPFIGLILTVILFVIYNIFKNNENAILSEKILKEKISEKKKDLEINENKLNDLKNKFKYLTSIVSYKEALTELKSKLYYKQSMLDEINSKINLSKKILSYKELEKELYTLEIGVFEKKYNYELSEEYNIQLKNNRKKQKKFIQDKLAIKISESSIILNLTLKNSEINKLKNNLFKLSLRTFNSETDLALNKLTLSNFINSRKKIESSYDQINKLLLPYDISININFFKLKIEELQLQYEYLVKINEEREEQRAIKEQMREEAKLQAEIEKLQKEASKEEGIYQKAIEKAKLELEKASSKEKLKLELRIKSLEEDLKSAEEKSKRAKSMAQQTKSGYVYVISNIGSFGENIYKIGLTRRLEPLDRVKELSDASVPFSFDVHALIYSNDAPALEKELHNHFNFYRVNKVNSRKEFFKVSLDEIEKVVNLKTNSKVKFTKLAQALEYRQSLLVK